MTSRVGADLENHPKIRYAWGQHHSALGLHLLGLSFAQRTGGFVSHEFVTEKLPAMRERTLAVAALVAVAPGEAHPMWEAVEGGWRIHNFAKHAEFRTEEEERALRATRKAAGAKGAQARWQGATTVDTKLPSTRMASQNGLLDFAITDKEEVVVVVEVEPQNSQTSSSSNMAKPEHLALSRRLAAAILANDSKAPVAPTSIKWLNASRLLLERDGRTVEEVEAVIDWCQADEFWRSNILSMPTLRRQFTQLRARMTSTPRAPRDTTTDDRRRAAAQAIYGGQPA